MDENDFDQILHTDFHPNTAPPPPELHHEHEQHHEEKDNVDLGQTTLQDEHPQDETRDISRESDAYHFVDDVAGPSSLDRQPPLPTFGRTENDNGGSDRELTFEDKKARQRDQNRCAALKSRAKKRDR